MDIKVRNRYTQQDSTFTNLKVKYKEGFDGTEAGSPGMAVGVIDTLVTLEAGEYEVISYTTYNKTSKIPLESTASLKENSFIIKGNLVEVRFEDYEKDAFDLTQEIYRKLSIPGFEEARADIEAYVNKKKGYKKNKYQYKPETVELVEKNWSFALEQWDYKL